jgi:4-amino-4-deoxy-L-arabinose transferase-like glycosyltransferase
MNNALRLSPLAVFALAATIFLVGLGSYGLVEQSDARYAVIAREMSASGDYLFPTLQGIRHFHKPPLIYWLTLPGYAIFGPTAWGSRIALALLGLLLALVVYRFARRHLPGAAPWSALLLATTPGVIGASRMLTIDLLLTLCLTAALICWYSFRSGEGGTPTLVGFFALTGLVFLAKGPVGWLLMLLVIASMAFLIRDFSRRQRRSWGLWWGIPLALAIALPWYAFVMAKTPGLTGYFLGQQLAGRLREGGMGHPHPWFYFLGVYPLLGVPWIFLAPAGWQVLRGRDRALATFLGLWAVVPPVFFSLPPSKLPLYVLPSYPALALLAAAALEEEARARRPLLIAGATFLILGAGLAGVGLGAIPVASRDLVMESPGALRFLVLPVAGALGFAGAAAIVDARRRPRRACLALALALAFLVSWSFLNGRSLPFHSAEKVGRAVAAVYRPGDTLVIYRSRVEGVSFYAGGAPPPLLAEVQRETGFEPPGKLAPTIDEGAFRELLQASGRVLVVTQEKHRARLPGLIEIAHGGGYVLFSSR